MGNEISPDIAGQYHNIIKEVCNINNNSKALGANYNSIFSAIENLCNSMKTDDFTLGELYKRLCEAVTSVVGSITQPIAKFIIDLSKKLVDFAQSMGLTVEDKRQSLVDSATSMTDATSYIEINEKNKLAYYCMSNGTQEAWCAHTVRTFLSNVPGIDKQMLEYIKDFKSVDQFIAWGRKIGYNETYKMKPDKRAEYISNNVRPGDIMVQKRNGISHVGIVVEVYSDGSFKTAEGNWGDKLTYVTRKPNDKGLSGFINMSRYLDNNAIPSIETRSLDTLQLSLLEDSEELRKQSEI